MTQTIAVSSEHPWIASGVQVRPGEKYRFTAHGQWFDAGIPCGPEGYERWWLKPLVGLRRVRPALWFELVGCLDKDLSTAFRIGAGTTQTFQRGGALYVFANDAPGFYGNNKGQVELTVTRL